MKNAEETALYGPDKIAIPLSELQAVVDATPSHVDKIARGYFLGTTSFNKRREIRHELEKKVTERIGKKGKMLVDKLFELAQGVYIAEKVGNKEIRYYQVPPNLQAIVYMLDRVLGKPTQYVEKSEEKKGIMVVEHIIKNLAGDKVVEGTAVETIANDTK